MLMKVRRKKFLTYSIPPAMSLHVGTLSGKRGLMARIARHARLCIPVPANRRLRLPGKPRSAAAIGPPGIHIPHSHLLDEHEAKHRRVERMLIDHPQRTAVVAVLIVQDTVGRVVALFGQHQRVARQPLVDGRQLAVGHELGEKGWFAVLSCGTRRGRAGGGFLLFSATGEEQRYGHQQQEKRQKRSILVEQLQYLLARPGIQNAFNATVLPAFVYPTL